MHPLLFISVMRGGAILTTGFGDERDAKTPCATPVSEMKNIGLLWAKVPRFCLESTDVSIKEVRCF